ATEYARKFSDRKVDAVFNISGDLADRARRRPAGQPADYRALGHRLIVDHLLHHAVIGSTLRAFAHVRCGNAPAFLTNVTCMCLWHEYLVGESTLIRAFHERPVPPV